nr:MAG TPA: hypothetical protein [Caudoviricetes sp.]
MTAQLLRKMQRLRSFFIYPAKAAYFHAAG